MFACCLAMLLHLLVFIKDLSREILTCSSEQQGPGVLSFSQQDTPSPQQSEYTCPLAVYIPQQPQNKETNFKKKLLIFVLPFIQFSRNTSLQEHFPKTGIYCSKILTYLCPHRHQLSIAKTPPTNLCFIERPQLQFLSFPQLTWTTTVANWKITSTTAHKCAINLCYMT